MDEMKKLYKFVCTDFDSKLLPDLYESFEKYVDQRTKESDRNMKIFIDHYANGISYVKLGEKWCLTSGRIGQICNSELETVHKYLKRCIETLEKEKLQAICKRAIENGDYTAIPKDSTTLDLGLSVEARITLANGGVRTASALSKVSSDDFYEMMLPGKGLTIWREVSTWIKRLNSQNTKETVFSLIRFYTDKDGLQCQRPIGIYKNRERGIKAVHKDFEEFFNNWDCRVEIDWDPNGELFSIETDYGPGSYLLEEVEVEE